MSDDFDMAGDVVRMHAEWARDGITLVKQTVTARDTVWNDATVAEAGTAIRGIFTPQRRDLAASRVGGVVERWDELRVLPGVNVEPGDLIRVDGATFRVEAVVPAYRQDAIVERVARMTAVTGEA